MDYIGLQSICRFICYGLIAACTATTAWQLWKAAHSVTERRVSLKRTKKRFARFMASMTLWSIIQGIVLMVMDATAQDIRWLLTIPTLIMALAVLDIWRYFAINGEEEKRR